MRLTEGVNRLEQAGLPGSVVTRNKVYPWVEVERGALQVSEIGQAKLTDCHYTACDTLD